MTDKELLELAAKSCGRLGPHGNAELLRPNEELHHDGEGYWFWPTGDSWNPLTDDGDALRLAVKLGMDIRPMIKISTVNVWSDTADKWIGEFYGDTDDPYTATRRAILRAAAEIGRAMP